jgi:glutamate dehydrogenase (NAD(P)+)
MTEELDPFKISQQQLDGAAEVMKLDKTAHQLLREPMRTLIVEIPVKMRDGSTKVFTGFRVLYNNARGPGKGGIRFHPQENLNTVKALGAWMTWKTSLADLPMGGAKGGVICDPKSMNMTELENLSRGYARAIGRAIGPDIDVPAPDVYTTPQIMAWIMDEHSKMVGHEEFALITGKPVELGGSQGRYNSTAMGGMYIMREAAKLRKLDIKKAKIAIQGLGNAGKFAFDLSRKLGAKVVAISDSTSGLYSENGLDYDKVIKAKEEKGELSAYADKNAQKITNEKLLELDVDVLIPAAVENQITAANADRIKADIILELANGPVTPDADAILFEKGKLDLPDFLVNSGGVIVSYFEWVQNRQGYYWTEDEVYKKLDTIMTKSFSDILTTQKKYLESKKKISPRSAAYIVAVDRVAKAMKLRGWY